MKCPKCSKEMISAWNQDPVEPRDFYYCKCGHRVWVKEEQ